MNKEQFQQELEYSAAVSIASSMLRRHLITQNEFEKIKATLINKYNPVIRSLQNAVSGSSPRKR